MLEVFTETEAPNAMIYRWTSCAGTGKNLYGRATLYGHATLGGVLQLKHEVLGYYVERHPPGEVRDLYDLFVGDDQEKIERRMKDIWDEFLDRWGDVLRAMGGPRPCFTSGWLHGNLIWHRPSRRRSARRPGRNRPSFASRCS
jgi:hypothetical protein